MSKCIQCGKPGIWRFTPMDDICVCQDCEARMEVERAIDRQFEEMFAFPGATIILPVPAKFVVHRTRLDGSVEVSKMTVDYSGLGPNDESLGRNRRRKRQLRQGVVSERARQLKRTRRFWRGVVALEDDGEFGRTRVRHG